MGTHVPVCIKGERKYQQQYERGTYTNYERLMHIIGKKNK